MNTIKYTINNISSSFFHNNRNNAVHTNNDTTSNPLVIHSLVPATLLSHNNSHSTTPETSDPMNKQRTTTIAAATRSHSTATTDTTMTNATTACSTISSVSDFSSNASSTTFLYHTSTIRDEPDNEGQDNVNTHMTTASTDNNTTQLLSELQTSEQQQHGAILMQTLLQLDAAIASGLCFSNTLTSSQSSEREKDDNDDCYSYTPSSRSRSSGYCSSDDVSNDNYSNDRIPNPNSSQNDEENEAKDVEEEADVQRRRKVDPDEIINNRIVRRRVYYDTDSTSNNGRNYEDDDDDDDTCLMNEKFEQNYHHHPKRPPQNSMKRVVSFFNEKQEEQPPMKQRPPEPLDAEAITAPQQQPSVPPTTDSRFVIDMNHFDAVLVRNKIVHRNASMGRRRTIMLLSSSDDEYEHCIHNDNHAPEEIKKEDPKVLHEYPKRKPEDNDPKIHQRQDPEGHSSSDDTTNDSESIVDTSSSCESEEEQQQLHHLQQDSADDSNSLDQPQREIEPKQPEQLKSRLIIDRKTLDAARIRNNRLYPNPADAIAIADKRGRCCNDSDSKDSAINSVDDDISLVEAIANSLPNGNIRQSIGELVDLDAAMDEALMKSAPGKNRLTTSPSLATVTSDPRNYNNAVAAAARSSTKTILTEPADSRITRDNHSNIDRHYDGYGDVELGSIPVNDNSKAISMVSSSNSLPIRSLLPHRADTMEQPEPKEKVSATLKAFIGGFIGFIIVVIVLLAAI